MNRKDFILKCTACLGITGTALLLPGCGATKYFDAAIDGPDMLIPVGTFFTEDKSGERKALKYIVAENDQLEYPVSVFRFSENDYSALSMRCTHQGTELQVFGDRLQCPAHGSEFSNRGVVKNGPADMNLRMFPIKVEASYLRVNLS